MSSASDPAGNGSSFASTNGRHDAPAAARVLLAILVYNGREFVPRCIESARAVTSEDHEVDVLVLDDCSPEPGWSDDLRDICRKLSVGYYRSPRNLGIPRNMNLALLRGMSAGYTHVVICNSDVILPANLADAMVEVAESDDRIGSVTAWSNNVSIYSLPNDNADASLAHQGAVDFVSAALHGEFEATALDIPTGVGFCMMVPTRVARDVGLLDPVFGRGYCEEVDWCQRSVEVGYRTVLAPSAFVYHIGNASTRAEGLLARGHTSVWAHERVVDMRHPDYRRRVEEFGTSPIMGELCDVAVRRIVVCAAREWGYSVEASWLHRTPSALQVHFVVEPDGRRPLVTGRFQGFTAEIPVEGTDVLTTIAGVVGQPPAHVSVFERGRFADILAAEAEGLQLPFADRRPYPERV